MKSEQSHESAKTAQSKGSHISISSEHSIMFVHSKVSVALKYAKAEAAKAKMEFAMKKADLQIQKAKLVEQDEIATTAANHENPTLETIKNEKAFAAAKA